MRIFHLDIISYKFILILLVWGPKDGVAIFVMFLFTFCRFMYKLCPTYSHFFLMFLFNFFFWRFICKLSSIISIPVSRLKCKVWPFFVDADRGVCMNKNRWTQKEFWKKIYLYIYLFLCAIIMNFTKMEKWLKCLVYS